MAMEFQLHESLLYICLFISCVCILLSLAPFSDNSNDDDDDDASDHLFFFIIIYQLRAFAHVYGALKWQTDSNHKQMYVLLCNLEKTSLRKMAKILHLSKKRRQHCEWTDDGVNKNKKTRAQMK